MAPRSYRLTVSRLALNIVEWGDPVAPPLILQHGGRDHARSWDWVAEAFAADHRVIAPDLRGHGDSAWSNDGCYEMLDYVDDFAAIVRTSTCRPARWSAIRWAGISSPASLVSIPIG